MIIRNLHLARSTFAIFLLLSVLSACTHIYKPPMELVSGYEQANTIPLKAGLVLNDELHTAKWERKMLGDTFRIPLGDSLAKNSEALVRKLFADVVIGKSTIDFNLENIDVIVIPTMVSVEKASGPMAWSPSVLTIFLEWKFQDNDSRLVWVDTIKGEGTAVAGNIFTHKTTAQIRIKMALDALFKNSHEAISNAQEIKDLVKTSEN